MNEIFYLEPSEEITGVIDRIRKTKALAIALVIPRGSSIAQSIVNLKLLKKAGDELEKEVSLVATDRIARNLASQIGITVFSKVSEAEAGRPKLVDGKPAGQTPSGDSVGTSPLGGAKKPTADGDFKINSYYYDKDKEGEESSFASPYAKATEDRKATDDKEEDDVDGQEEDEQEEVPEPPEGKPNHRVFGKATGEVEPKEYQQQEEEKSSFANPSAAEARATDDREEPKPHPDFAKREVEKRQIEPHRPDPKPEMPKGSKIFSRKRKIIIGLIATAVVTILVLSYLFIPYATASIAIKTENLPIKEEIIVDKNVKAVDVEKLTVPGNLIETTKEESKDYIPTGKKDVGTKASGTLVFSNNTLLDKTLKSGATVTSGSGVKFTLTADVILPKGQIIIDSNGLPAGVKAGTANGTVEATATGDSGNLPASTNYTISGTSNVTASGATTGGVTKQVTIVSADDLKKAEADLLTQITTDAKTDLSTEASDAKVTIVDSTIQSEVVSSSSDKVENDEAEKFTLTMNLKLFGIGFSESDVRKVMTDSAVKSLESGKMFVGTDKSEMTYEVSSSSVDDGYVKLNVIMIGRMGQDLSAESIKTKIKNKNKTEAKRAIEAIDSVTSANISIFPSFYNRLPVLTKRIRVNFSYSE